jgi:transcriptional regulator with XRE-family HTH domain
MALYRDDLIRMELARRRMRHEDLEKASGVSRGTISTIVNGQLPDGQPTDPRVSTLEKIAKALDIKLADLFRREEAQVTEANS